jgi:hypothetical protein
VRRHKRKLLALAVTALVAALALVLGPERVSRRGYDRIKAGMTPAEVEAILGPPADISEWKGLTPEDFDGRGYVHETWGLPSGEPISRSFWQGRRGLLFVNFSRGRAVDKVWTPWATWPQRFWRQWERWFP